MSSSPSCLSLHHLWLAWAGCLIGAGGLFGLEPLTSSVECRSDTFGQLRRACDLALQLGAKWGWGLEKYNRGAAGVWAGVNRGSFALWILGLGLFGLVGLGAAILGLWQL